MTTGFERCSTCATEIDAPEGTRWCPSCLRKAKTLAREQCANFYAADACLPRDGVCLVLEGKPCRYFESALAPVMETPEHKCPDCGGDLKRQQRVCDACARARRRRNGREFRATSRARRIRTCSPLQAAPERLRASRNP